MRRKHTVDASPRRVFLSARAGAEKRGIPWRLTFDEWWSVWAPHWERRANEQLALCREADKGAYELGNVRVDTQQANTNDFKVFRGLVRAGAVLDQIERGTTFADRVARFERRLLRAALRRYGTKTAAALALGMTFRAFRYRVKLHGVTGDSD